MYTSVLKPDINNGHLTGRHTCIFLKSHLIIVGLRSVSDKSCTEN